MVLRVPVKLLVVVTGILSTAASFAGGIILYFEGLALLERTIEEGSISDRSSLSALLKKGMQQAVDATDLQGSILSTYPTVHQSDAALSEWAYPSLFYQVYSTGMYAISIHVLPLDSMVDGGDGRYGNIDVTWYDLLGDGSKMYIYGHYNSSQYEACGNQSCVFSYEVNPKTGVVGRYVYKYLEDMHIRLGGILSAPVFNGWEVKGANFWRRAAVWYAYDGTPGLYFPYVRVLPSLSHIPSFRNRTVIVTSFILADTWTEVIKEFTTPATIIVLDYSGRGNILGTNAGLDVAKLGCTNDNVLTDDCLLFIDDLPEQYAQAARTLNHTPEGEFIRSEKYWLARKVLFQPSEKDLLDGMSLLWMRSTGSVEDELDRALAFFIFFVVLVIVLDVVIGVSEVLLFARPLCRLSESMLAIRHLELDLLDQKLEEVLGCVQVSELASLVAGVRFASLSLREYRSYLPQTVFEGEEEEEEKDVSHQLSTGSHNSQASSASLNEDVRLNNLGVRITEVPVIALLFETRLMGLPLPVLSHSHSKWLQVMQEKQKLYKGTIQRIMGEQVLVTWTKGKILGWATKAVEYAASVMQAPQSPQGTLVGISGGKTIAGKMGTDTLRSFNMIGERERVAAMLVRLNTTLGTSMLVDSGIANHLNMFLHRPVDRVVTSLSSRAVVVFQVVLKVTSALEGQEWMYTEETDENDTYVKAWALLMDGRLSDAIELLEKLQKNDTIVQGLLRRVQAFSKCSPSGQFCTQFHFMSHTVDPAQPPRDVMADPPSHDDDIDSCSI